MIVEGRINNIIFSGDNEFKIIRLDLNDSPNEEFVVKGTIPLVERGDYIKCDGEIVNHPTYGNQMNVRFFEKVLPTAQDDIIGYLAANITGVGKVTAERIYDEFKEDTLNVIVSSPEELTKVKGINKEKAFNISEEYREKEALFSLTKELKAFNLSMNNILKVYETLGTDAIKVLKENPYLLLSILPRIHFKEVDKIAHDLGFLQNDINRIKACILHAINIAMQNGNTYVNKNNLIGFVQREINVDYDEIENGLISLQAEGHLIRESITIEEKTQDEAGDIIINEVVEEIVELTTIKYAETNIATTLLSIEANESFKIRDIDRKLKVLEKGVGIDLTNSQKSAITSINDNNVVIITGGPGTGKTTITQFIISLVEGEGYSVSIAAPTGKAAKRISDVTGHKASTIHKLLALNKFADDDSAVYVEAEKLYTDLLIVDEASMIDIYLMNIICKALNPGMKLVIIGDKDQLESVGPGRVLQDLISSGEFKVERLDQIFRQAKRSNIVMNAYRVNSGQSLKNYIGKDEFGEEYIQDLKYINEEQDKNISLKLIEYLKTQKFEDFFAESQILSPTKRGTCGTVSLNKIVQESFNTGHKESEIQKYGDIEYKVGDRVMQIANDYDMLWEMGSELGTGIFNGETGVISDIDKKEKLLEIIFDDGKIASYTLSDLKNISHSYVMTVHKSQGSEFDTVILLLPRMIFKGLLKRNILYTAITRAKRNLVIIGSEYALNYMISQTDTRIRKTNLSEVIKEIKFDSENRKGMFKELSLKDRKEKYEIEEQKNQEVKKQKNENNKDYVNKDEYKKYKKVNKEQLSKKIKTVKTKTNSAKTKKDKVNKNKKTNKKVKKKSNEKKKDINQKDESEVLDFTILGKVEK